MHNGHPMFWMCILKSLSTSYVPLQWASSINIPRIYLDTLPGNECTSIRYQESDGEQYMMFLYVLHKKTARGQRVKIDTLLGVSWRIISMENNIWSIKNRPHVAHRSLLIAMERNSWMTLVDTWTSGVFKKHRKKTSCMVDCVWTMTLECRGHRMSIMHGWQCVRVVDKDFGGQSPRRYT